MYMQKVLKKNIKIGHPHDSPRSRGYGIPHSEDRPIITNDRGSRNVPRILKQGVKLLITRRSCITRLALLRHVSGRQPLSKVLRSSNDHLQ